MNYEKNKTNLIIAPVCIGDELALAQLCASAVLVVILLCSLSAIRVVRAGLHSKQTCRGDESQVGLHLNQMSHEHFFTHEKKC